MEEKGKKRICPVCDTYSDGDKCPKDGAPTFEPPEEGKEKGEFRKGDIFDGKYRIEEVIGKGGMGIVYKATQLSMGREVALKVLSKELGEDLNQIKRFYREGMSASKLSHPNTIKVYDFGCTKERCLYMAMEFLRGKPLALVLSKEKLSLKRILKISIQILKSLAEAHKVGIVHRDLKPQNIFLNEIYGEEDFVKVLDFGIARLQVKDTEESSLTKTGTVLGTPQYMSPEQAKGEKVEHRSDIYSFGVILYEMLSGGRPFDAGTPLAVLMKHINEQVPQISQTQGGEEIPSEILNILYKCLEKDKEKRPSSIEEIIPVLKKYASYFEDVEPLAPEKVEKKDVSQKEMIYISKTPVPEVKTLEEEKTVSSDIIFAEKKRKIFYIIPLITILIIIFAVLFINKKEERTPVLLSKPEIYEKDVVKIEKMEEEVLAPKIQEIEREKVVEEKEIFEEEISALVPEKAIKKKEEKIPVQPKKRIIKKKEREEDYEQKW